jgi:hypothetical protein
MLKSLSNGYPYEVYKRRAKVWKVLNWGQTLSKYSVTLLPLGMNFP